MSYWEAILYGVVQGIGEYLPISSSGHLVLLPKILGHEDPGLAFDVFLHMGTLFATLLYFWKDWLNILAGVPVIGKYIQPPVVDRAREIVSWKLIVLATIPALIAGAGLHKVVENNFRGTSFLIFTFSIGGVVLWAADRFFSRKRVLSEMTSKDAIWIGVSQCFALIPGISRSGSTMTAARFLKLDRQAAARFSFLISAPVTLAATVFELRHYKELYESPVGGGPMIVAGLCAFGAGLLAIGGLLRLLRTHSYLPFAIYRVALAVSIYLYFGMGA